MITNWDDLGPVAKVWQVGRDLWLFNDKGERLAIKPASREFVADLRAHGVRVQLPPRRRKWWQR